MPSVPDGIVNTRKCTKCGLVKNLGLFHKYPQNKIGRASICKECSKLKAKEPNMGQEAYSFGKCKICNKFTALKSGVCEDCNKGTELPAFLADLMGGFGK